MADGEWLMGRQRNEAPGGPGGLAIKHRTSAVRHTEKLVPQPQPPVAFGFSNAKPCDCIVET